MDKVNQMDQYRKIINEYFTTKYIHQYPINIHDPLIHLFNDGKRIRPILFLAFSDFISGFISDFNENANKNKNMLLSNAITIELLHCLSLVIDDLPEMDNELLRRNKPCFHIKYGITKTHIFIYYMITRLLCNITEIMDGETKLNVNESKLKILEDINYITKYLINNLIDGQYIDMEFCNLDAQSLTIEKIINIDKNISIIKDLVILILEEFNIILDEDTEKELEKCIILNIKKTGTLFALPITIGFLNQLFSKGLQYTGNEILEPLIINDIMKINDNNQNINDKNTKNFNLGDDNLINLLITTGFFLGFFYQTSDDFLDRDNDKMNKKPNICNLLKLNDSILLISNGIKITSNILEYIIDKCRDIWPTVNINSNCIQQLLDIITQRVLNTT
jgi:geranylgeranyl pyrophosphate synthase